MTDKDATPSATLIVPRELSIAHHSPAHRVTSVLLNGKKFPAWSRSFCLFLGGKGKTNWQLETEQQPQANDPKRAQWDIDNCTVLGWFFNSMEEHIYNMFMYCDTAPRLWAALTQMYAHARNDVRIYELYQEISHAKQEVLNLSVAEFFGYLQSRWEELAQYEPMSDFPAETASIVVKRLTRQHTFQFLMGLKIDFEPLRIQILNTSPMPSLYEVFATIDSEERRRRIIQPQGLLATPTTSPVNDQMALAANSRPPSGKIICHHCGDSGHVKARCYKLHPELKPRVTRNRSYGSSSSGPSRTETLPSSSAVESSPSARPISIFDSVVTPSAFPSPEVTSPRRPRTLSPLPESSLDMGSVEFTLVYPLNLPKSLEHSIFIQFGSTDEAFKTGAVPLSHYKQSSKTVRCAEACC
ncbi:hypothetical protein RHGRI_017018 [Rhododendron griersonianum]|uniref:CCHC-type domain-containing protein n=1 Tax=Rhododendron griersonianum TaxID=479676 RepID=A0AAV6JWC3_9ERIC|nr:hypothetical protein RHGRI_017018 [Rhododendron griersonianum]